MPLAAPLLPVATLLLGAAVLPLATKVMGPRTVLAVAIGVSAIALLLMGALYLSHPSPWTAGLWRPQTLFGAELGYYADSLSISFVLILVIVALVVLLADVSSASFGQERPESLGMLFLALAAACSIILAADLVTLCLSWGLLDLALFVLTARSNSGRGGSGAATRYLLINYLAGVALLGGLVVLQTRGEAFSFQAAPLPALVISLLMVAALMRLRLYPAFLAQSPMSRGVLLARVLWHIVPAVVGGYLLVRALGLAAMASLPGSELGLVLASLSIALSPFGLWFEVDLERAAPYIVLNQVGYMALAAVVGVAYSPAIIGSQVVTLGFALVALFLGLTTWSGPISRPYELLRQSCVWVAIAALLAVPLTMGFVGRQLLYGSLAESRLAPLVLVALLANSFMVPPLLKLGSTAAPVEGARDRFQFLKLAALTVTALPLVLFGLLPELAGRVLGMQSASAVWPTPLALVYSPGTISPTVLSVVTVGSLALGYLMYRHGSLMVDKAGDSLETLHTVAKIEWLYAGAGRTVEVVATVLENVGGFFEGRRSAGWILVFATLLGLLLLSS
jgi:formate hydrogenlyase subunit 3/multisubunit Na+/H+ antiporter MnhD subunit